MSKGSQNSTPEEMKSLNIIGIMSFQVFEELTFVEEIFQLIII